MCLGMGVNPHAPYSVGPDLRVELRDFLALHRDLATAWHLAEVSEEIGYLETGAGHFAEFLERHGFPPPFEEVPKCSPLEFLQKAELFDRLDLAFHFNFFTKNEAKLFAPHAVWCTAPPRIGILSEIHGQSRSSLPAGAIVFGDGQLGQCRYPERF